MTTMSCASLLLCGLLTINWMMVSAVKYDWFGDTCQKLAKFVDQANQPIKPTCASGCVAPGSLKLNEPCFFHSQCETNWCASIWKICTQGSWTSLYPNANCNPRCDDDQDVSECTCADSNFPNNWVTCTDESMEKDTCDPGRLPAPFPQYYRLESDGALVEDDVFAIAQVCFHNKFRQEAGLQPVEWDHSIAKFASYWVEYLNNYNGMLMKHSSPEERAVFDSSLPRLGENLYWRSEYGTTLWDLPIFGANSVIAWYSEMKFYEYAGEGGGYNGCEMRQSVHPTDERPQVGHLTALMWNTTNKIGCDYIRGYNDPEITTLISCNYAPAGNMQFNDVYQDAFGDRAYCLINANPETQVLYGGLPYCKSGSIDCSPYQSLADKLFKERKVDQSTIQKPSTALICLIAAISFFFNHML